MAASSGSSRSARSGSRSKASSSRSKSGGSRSKAGTTRKRRTTRSSSARRAPSAGRSDKSVQAFREALERSVVTVPRDRLQEVVDDAVERGRMTRKDANEIVSKLITRGRKYTDDLISDLEKLLDQARKDLETRTAKGRKQATQAASKGRKQATQAAGRVGRAARDVADRPLAEADRIRRRAGVAAGGPITAYDQLTASQIKTRLTDLSPAELRKVRTQEKRGKARKGILDAIEKKLK